MQPAVKAEGVSKAYGSTIALSSVWLEIQSGTIHGIIGPNGSGKTTLMRIIASLTERDGGSVTVHGVDPSLNPIEIKKTIGYVPENPALYQSMTATEYLNFVGSIRGIGSFQHERLTAAFIKSLELEKFVDEPIGSLSFGSKQKVSIIAALLHDPKVIILDEALKGVDPRSSRVIRDLLKALSRNGKTVLFSTHVIETVDTLCDQLSILYRGRIVDTGTAAELIERNSKGGSTLEDVFLNTTSDSPVGNIGNDLAGILGSGR